MNAHSPPPSTQNSARGPKSHLKPKSHRSQEQLDERTSLRMKTTTNKHVIRPPNESPTRRKHKQTSPKTAAQTSYTTLEQVQPVAQHEVRKEQWLRIHRAISSQHTRHETECNKRQDRNDGAPWCGPAPTWHPNRKSGA